MNWITTNIRLPEDLYMDLKMKAARERKSIAAVIREELSDGKKITKGKKERFLRDIKKFRTEMGRKHPHLNLSKALIEMRYEQ